MIAVLPFRTATDKLEGGSGTEKKYTVDLNEDLFIQSKLNFLSEYQMFLLVVVKLHFNSS